MPELLVGPLLRYADDCSATVWVETGAPCEVVVTTDSGTGGTARTWQVAGHHYALVAVTGLTPGSTTAYRVTLDGVHVWPEKDSPFPPSTIRTLPARFASAAVTEGGAVSGTDPGAPLRVTFGSCRWASPSSARRSRRSRSVGPDALDTLARHLAAVPGAERPDVLLLLGDQVYADETSVPMRQWLAGRRAPGQEPQDQVGNYEEYTRLYHESWRDPEIRWLLSTVPSCMIFDDHDVIDDWNTSASWRDEMRATGWWPERILGGLVSYWVYQHLGNLSPARLAQDELYAAVRAADDAEELLREFTRRADADPSFHRWSYRRDFGGVRLLMVDTRAARVLEEGKRAMLADSQFSWLAEQAGDRGSGRATAERLAEHGSTYDEADGETYHGTYGNTYGEQQGPPGDHLLIGSSLPWLLPQAIHDTESWSEALCSGERGPRWARIAERIRRAADLEHWAAFRESFEALGDLCFRVGSGAQAPATVCVLSGDVHHAYLAEARPRSSPGALRSRILQLTCSPVHNAVPAGIRAGFRFGWGRSARLIGRALARHGRVPATSVGWDRIAGPHFGNQLMTLTLDGHRARLRLERAVPGDGGRPRLRTVLDTELS